MSKIVVGIAEVNAKNNPNLAEIAAADLEKKIADRFEEGAEIKTLASSQNERAFTLFAVVDGEEKINEDEVEEEDEDLDDSDETPKSRKKKGGKK